MFASKCAIYHSADSLEELTERSRNTERETHTHQQTGRKPDGQTHKEILNVDVIERSVVLVEKREK